MQGQTSKVARGLRTIGNNFANVAKKSKELSYEVQGTTKTISLFDEKTKDLKSTYEIFNSMADDWENMTNAEKQNLAITYAGGRIGLAPNRLKCGKDGVVSVSEHNVWMPKAFSTKVA
jgi:hypothetical protein